MKFTLRSSSSTLLVALLFNGAMPLPGIAHTIEPAAVDTRSSLPLLLAQDYSDQVDPKNYLVSEKLDGVRAYWDGKQLYFRSGRPIHAPAWFTAPFPTHALDGELWMGRETFDRLSAAVRRQEPVDSEWKQISYQLYELPGGAGSFEQRVAILRSDAANAGVPWMQVVSQVRINDRQALQRKLSEIVNAGGEGLMLHRADATWQTGRSETLLKLKPQPDAEARIVAYESGKGKYEGMIGALIVESSDGRRFRLGSGLSDVMRRHPPAIGKTVTYRYRGLTASGLPRFASFWRVRESE